MRPKKKNTIINIILHNSAFSLSVGRKLNFNEEIGKIRKGLEANLRKEKEFTENYLKKLSEIEGEYKKDENFFIKFIKRHSISFSRRINKNRSRWYNFVEGYLRPKGVIRSV